MENAIRSSAAVPVLPSKERRNRGSSSHQPQIGGVGHVFFDVKLGRIHCQNETARTLHREGLPLVPADLERTTIFMPDGEPVKAARLPLIAAWKRNEPVEATFLWPRQGGPAWCVSWSASPLQDDAGETIGIFGSVECGPPKPNGRVIAELAHDLATPLQSFQLLGMILDKMPQADAELHRVLDPIRAAGDRAMNIAQDLLACCRGPMKAPTVREAAWFELDQFLERLAREQAVAAERKGLLLTHDFAAAKGFEVYTDQVRLGRVLANFLVNAIRYTVSGRVDFSTAWRNDAHGKTLAVGVSDTGPGISQAEKESIFQPFERGKAGRHTDPGGSGLGLAVADRLVEELGLTMDVFSEHGHGSTFHLLLPESLLRTGTTPN